MRAWPLVVVFALLTAAVSAHAQPTRSASAAYLGGGDAVALSVGEANVGGARFWPHPHETRVSVAVEDLRGETTVVVCQDVDDDGLCSGRDARSAGCGAATLPEGVFVSGREVLVFVVSSSWGLPGGCEGLTPPSSGTITAWFA